MHPVEDELLDLVDPDDDSDLDSEIADLEAQLTVAQSEQKRYIPKSFTIRTKP